MAQQKNGDDAALITEAINGWHRLLDADAAGESARMLEAGLRETRLLFGDRPICRVLRPFFLTPREAARLAHTAETLMRALRKVYAQLRSSVAWRAVLNLSADDEAMLAADTQPFEPDVVARIDGFLVRGGAFQVIEYNAESPGGIAFGDTLVDIFRMLPVTQAFGREWRLDARPGLANTLAALRTADTSRRGGRPIAAPVIAVVDRLDAPTRREFEICAEFFTRNGCPSFVASPETLRFDGTRLTADGRAIDIVYKRVLVKELIARGGTGHPLVQAVRAGAVTCASGFGVHLLYRKELFALMHDDRYSASFDEEERDAVLRAVPWTRFVEDVEATIDGKRARLLDVIRSRRTNLVLKPTDDYGGSGVVLGWLVDDATWAAKLKASLAAPHVVQQRVTLGHEVFPVVQHGVVTMEPFYADINPYIWNGVRSDGFGGRLASGELLNVTAGGGSAVPVMIVDRG